MSKKKKFTLGLLVVLVLGYFGAATYYSKHVVPNTRIGDLNLSGLNAEALGKQVDDNFSKLTIEVKDEVVTDYNPKLVDLGASIDKDKLIADIKNDQQAYRWPAEIFAPSDYDVKDYIKVDSKQLTKQLKKDGIYDQSNRIAPEDATLQLNDKTHNYEVVDETPGNTVNQKKFNKAIMQSITNLEPSIDTSKYYTQAKNGRKVMQAQADSLNNRINRNVKMTIKDNDYKIPKEELAAVVYLDDEGNVAVDETELYNYLYQTSLEFDNVDVKTDSRKVEESDMVPAYETIRDGLLSDDNKDIVGVADVYENTETFKHYVHPKDATYIEISISQQIMWVYKDNSLLVQTPVVTGNAAQGWDTPTGTYSIIEKSRDKVLDGSTVSDEFSYKVPVNYWMRLTNSGVGIHDIDWLNSSNAWNSRQVYTTNGSHGCINTPNDVMPTIYNNIPMGTPVYVTQ